MRIRPAVDGDIEALLTLHRAFCAADDHPHDAEQARAAFAGLLAEPAHGIVLVAEESDLVGYAVLTWGYSIESGGVESLLDEIYVARPAEGIGTRLVEACVATATEHGARTIFLETEAHNRRVRGLYARLGFDEESSVWMSRSLS